MLKSEGQQPRGRPADERALAASFDRGIGASLARCLVKGDATPSPDFPEAQRALNAAPGCQPLKKTMSIPAHHSFGPRVSSGTCIGSVNSHHRFIAVSSAIFFMSSFQLEPVYSI